MHNKTTCDKRLNSGALLRFLALVFVLGMGVQIVALRVGVHGAGGSLLLLAMWTPAVSALIAGRVTRGMAWAALKKFSLYWLLLGLLLGLAPGVLKSLLLTLSGSGHWDSGHFELAPGGHSIQAVHHLALVLGPGPQSFAYFALNLFLSLSLGSVMIGLVGGLGEELGWRTVLQPMLEERFGRFTGTCLVGLTWAYWHLPVNLGGYNDPRHPLWNALILFPLAVVALSFTLAWLTRRSKSVWPAALAHGANNTIGSAFVIVAKGWSADAAAEVLSVWLVAGFFVWRACRSPSPAAICSVKERIIDKKT